MLEGRGHQVAEARVVFGGRTEDPENMAWARENAALLVTGDRKFVSPRKFTPGRSAVLLLWNLYGDQVERVRDLIDVVEAEGIRGGPDFFMHIKPREFMVLR